MEELAAIVADEMNCWAIRAPSWRRLSWTLVIGFAAAATLGTESPSPSHRQPNLNQGAFEYAKELIARGHVINDKHGSWFTHRPSAKDENEFIHHHSMEEFGQWHLALDESHREDSKARYKFPFGDFKIVHRCALIAVISRARQHGYSDIENAARELLIRLNQQQHQLRRNRSDELSSE